MDISNVTIPYPYTDWKAIKELGSGLEHDDGVNYRYRACLGLGTEKDLTPDKENWAKPIDITPLSNTPYLSFTETRQLVTIAFIKKMAEDFPKGGKIVFEETGINNTIISKLSRSVKNAPEMAVDSNGRPVVGIKGEPRPFSTPLETVAPVATYVMGMTCHKMFFGEEGTITLPKRYSLLAEGLEKLNKKQKKELIARGRELWQDQVAEYSKKAAEEEKPDLSRYGQIKTSSELLYERINELSCENPEMYGGKFIFNETYGGNNKLKLALKTIASRENRDAGDDAYEPNIELCMFFALESGQALDYFLRNDYIGMASESGKTQKELKIMSQSGTVVADKDILTILSYCISLSGEKKHLFTADAIAVNL